jgi:hypothetical protein
MQQPTQKWPPHFEHPLYLSIFVGWMICLL